MKRNKILSIAVAAVVCLGSVSVFASHGEKSCSDKAHASKVHVQEAKGVDAEMCDVKKSDKGVGHVSNTQACVENHENKVMGEKMQRIELTEEEQAAKLEEIKESLALKLSKGEISQEEYDAVLAKIENGEAGFGKMGGMTSDDRAFGHMSDTEKCAENCENKAMGESVMKCEKGGKHVKGTKNNTTVESADVA